MYPLILYLLAVVPPASDSPGRLKGGNPWPQILTESPDCSGSWHLSLALGSWHQAEYVLPGGEGGILAQPRVWCIRAGGQGRHSGVFIKLSRDIRPGS